MSDLVSIIIPVHNSSKYITKCLESALNQTYKNIEIIVIENGSTDNSLEILKKYENKIKLKTSDISDIGTSRNLGIDISNGKYICFLDSDDELENTYVEKLINSIKKEESDISICDIKEKYEQTNKERIYKVYPIDKVIENKINLEEINYGPCNKLFKSNIIKENKIYFSTFTKYEDIPFVLKYILKVKKISKVNECLYIYNIHNNSEQTTIDKKIFDIIKVMNDTLKYVKKEEIENLYIKTITTFIVKLRYTKDKKLQKEFMEEAYKSLEENYPSWKSSKYIKNLNILKKLIIKNKLLLKIYINLYHIIH